MKSLRVTSIAATLLFSLSAVALAAGKAPATVAQSGKQPHSLMATKSAAKSKHGLMAAKTNDKKVRPAGHSFMGGSTGPNRK